MMLGRSYLRYFTQHSSSPFKYLFVENNFMGNNKVISVTFTREDLHNAFNAEMISEIKSVFDQIEQSTQDESTILDHPRCVVLTGRGKTFSAGADLNWMRKMADYTFDENMGDARQLYDMVNAIRTCKLPVIARVNGSALGGGAGIVSASDIAVSVSTAKFGFTEVKLGLLPAVISPFVLAKIGATHASRYFVTGELMSAATACNINLIQSVVDNEADLNGEVNTILSNICASSPTAVRASKNLVLQFSRPKDNTSEKDFVTEEIARMRVSKLGQDGLRSFLSKTKPSWVQSN
jgi:methylglutaconyl-CoA hydratase